VFEERCSPFGVRSDLLAASCSGDDSNASRIRRVTVANGQDPHRRLRFGCHPLFSSAAISKLCCLAASGSETKLAGDPVQSGRAELLNLKPSRKNINREVADFIRAKAHFSLLLTSKIQNSVLAASFLGRLFVFSNSSTPCNNSKDHRGFLPYLSFPCFGPFL
jgi:hypothetical protein